MATAVTCAGLRRLTQGSWAQHVAVWGGRDGGCEIARLSPTCGACPLQSGHAPRVACLHNETFVVSAHSLCAHKYIYGCL